MTQSERRAIFDTDRDTVLATLPEVGDVLRREVLESGGSLFASDSERVLAWGACAMTRYANYREEVREILADFRRAGIDFGV
jgi:hypothetical protein